MRIISRKKLREYWQQFPASEKVLDDWFRKVKAISPKNLAELRQVFPSVDIYGDCYIFNVGGNKYRVTAHIEFRLGILYVRSVMSHSEYDKDKWKDDC